MSKRVQAIVPDGLYDWLEEEARVRGMFRGGKPNISAMATLKLQMAWEQELASNPPPRGEGQPGAKGK